MFELPEIIRSRDLYFISDALHRQMWVAIERESVQALSTAIAPPGTYAQLPQEQPLRLAGM